MNQPTWEKLAGNGLPGKDETVGKTAVQVAPGNPDRVYALIEQGTPVLYRVAARSPAGALSARG